jgi:hypothetical protein
VEKLEYRLGWQREGRRPVKQIFQTEKAALEKADRILALEEVKANTQFADMPDLVSPPVVESRQVGEWGLHSKQAVDGPSEKAVERMQAWVNIGDEDHLVF